MKHVVQVTEDGTIVHLQSDELSLGSIGPTTTTRASHVEPVDAMKRLAFRILRLVCGERGRVAQWTRGWKGPWMVRVCGGGPSFRHSSREACIEWEVAHLQGRMLRGE